MHFVATDSNNQTYEAAVTEEHNSPRLRRMATGGSSAAFHGSAMEMVLAKELEVGDVVPVLGSRGPRFAVVGSVVRLQQRWKNVVVTKAGTVLLANGILTTTVCDGVDVTPNRANFSAAMENWRMTHQTVFEQSVTSYNGTISDLLTVRV